MSRLLTLYRRQQFMKDVGISEPAFLLLSVGELNKNKNHAVVIRALAELNDPEIHYCVAGDGGLRDDLEALVESINLAGKVHFLGYRNDIETLLCLVDVFVLPSIREGLNVSLMEAMASGLPCICSDIRGNRDLIKACKYRVCARNVSGFSRALKNMKENVCTEEQTGQENKAEAKKYGMRQINGKMKNIYDDLQDKEF